MEDLEKVIEKIKENRFQIQRLLKFAEGQYNMNNKFGKAIGHLGEGLQKLIEFSENQHKFNDDIVFSLKRLLEEVQELKN
jgi:hypothetical protein